MSLSAKWFGWSLSKHECELQMALRRFVILGDVDPILKSHLAKQGRFCFFRPCSLTVDAPVQLGLSSRLHDNDNNISSIISSSLLSIDLNEGAVCLVHCSDIALYGYSDIRSFMGGLLSSLNLKDVAVGIGSLSNTPEGYVTSFIQAKRASLIAVNRPDNSSICFFQDLGFYGLIDPVADLHLLKEFQDSILASIENDKELGPVLLDTIRTFVESNCSLNETAKKLYVHRNTVSYRLNQISRFTGLDFHQFEDRVLLYMALKVRRLLTT